mmetsp:Transcript_8896/g.15602  ORF Transcript_8896/g.15602 Transcript_8896/m.15602 type:complete len:223 (-) Transcript_8896:89-757(-)
MQDEARDTPLKDLSDDLYHEIGETPLRQYTNMGMYGSPQQTALLGTMMETPAAIRSYGLGTPRADADFAGGIQLETPGRMDSGLLMHDHTNTPMDIGGVGGVGKQLDSKLGSTPFDGMNSRNGNNNSSNHHHGINLNLHPSIVDTEQHLVRDTEAKTTNMIDDVSNQLIEALDKLDGKELANLVVDAEQLYGYLKHAEALEIRRAVSLGIITQEELVSLMND